MLLTANRDELRLGILGGGAIASVYFDAARVHGSFSLRALADPDPAVLAARCDAAPELAMYEDAAGLLADPGIDAVVLALPHDLHAVSAIRALDAGKDVISEKPIALSIDEAEAVAAAEARSGRCVVVRCYLRALEHHRWLRSTIASGALGDVTLLRGLFASDRRAALKDPSDWHGDWRRAGGGVVIDSGYHLVDLARCLLGEADSVSAQMRNTLGREDGSEDMCTLTLLHATGAVASLACVWYDNLRPFRWEREVYGSSGVAFIGDAHGCSELEARIRGGLPVRRRIEDWWATANRLAVLDCVRALTGRPLAADGAVSSADARQTLRLVLAAYFSAQTGAVVRPDAVPGDFRPGIAAAPVGMPPRLSAFPLAASD